MATGLTVVLAALYLTRWGRGDGLDLQVYRGALHVWREGKNPYASSYTRHHLKFTYPPLALAALAPLAWAPFRATQIGLWILSVGALALSVYIVCRQVGWRGGKLTAARALGWACLAVLVLEPVRSNFNYGQINTFLMALVVIDLLAVPQRHRGWLVGLAAAVKLTPLIFVLLLLLEKDWKSAGRGLLGAAATSAVMALGWPTASRSYWLHDVFDARRTGGVAYEGNQSWYGLLHRWPFPADGQTACWVVVSAVTVALALHIARRGLAHGQRVDAMVAIAFCGLLISPISWTHHWVWVALLPPVVLNRRNNMSTTMRAVLALVFLVAVVGPYWWFPADHSAMLLTDSLTLAGFAALLIWSVSPHSRASNRPVTPSPSMAISQADAGAGGEVASRSTSPAARR
jgi:alpha-1,2-mannosyltransferase